MSARGSGKLSDHMTRVYLGACLRRNLDLHLLAAISRPAQGMLVQAVLRRGCPAPSCPSRPAPNHPCSQSILASSTTPPSHRSMTAPFVGVFVTSEESRSFQVETVGFLVLVTCAQPGFFSSGLLPIMQNLCMET